MWDEGQFPEEKLDICAVGRGWCLISEEPGRRAAQMKFFLEIATSSLRAVKGER